MEPRNPLSAWLLASATSRGVRKARNNSARQTIMAGPPVNSASVNCQPIKTARMMPSSMTRFVDANSNAIAAVKSAPFRKMERASATAAYEHDDEAAPRPQASPRERRESSGSSRVISDLETTACTMPDRVNPRMSAQSTSQNMAKAKLSASTANMGRER